jgi:hypothetical protein
MECGVRDKISYVTVRPWVNYDGMYCDAIHYQHNVEDYEGWMAVPVGGDDMWLDTGRWIYRDFHEALIKAEELARECQVGVTVRTRYGPSPKDQAACIKTPFAKWTMTQREKEWLELIEMVDSMAEIDEELQCMEYDDQEWMLEPWQGQTSN